MHTHLLNILATWRITRLLGVDYGERGPFAILDRVREYVENKRVEAYNHNKSAFEQSNFWHETNEALRCEWCLSVWVGIALAIVTRQNVLWGLAYSAGALLFGRLFDRLEQ